MNVVAVLGVGRVGSAVARVAITAGYDVRVAGSGAAEDIALLTEIVIPGAVAMSAEDAVRDADVVIIAVPLSKYRSVEPAMLAGKIAIDVMNYWAPVDGILNEFEAADATSSEIVARYFSESRVVKTLNHIGYHDLEDHRQPPHAAGRRALAIASDDETAADEVGAMIDRFGFDSRFAGPLHIGSAFEPGTNIFNGAFDLPGLDAELERTAAHSI